MKNNIRLATLLGTSMMAMVALSACNQNPYSDISSALGTKESDVGVTPNPTPIPSTPLLRVVVAQVHECFEGTTCKIPVEATVKAPGTPIMKFEGLPAGATYNEADHTLYFTPGYDFVDRDAESVVTMKSIPVRIILRNSMDPVTAYEKTFTLNVKDAERKIVMADDDAVYSVSEGETLTRTLEVKSEDYTKGFSFRATQVPEGISILPVANSTKFTLKFTPNAFAASLTDTLDADGIPARNYTIKGDFVAPSGTAVAWEKKIHVRDVRLSPLVTAPTAAKIGMTGEFSIVATDPNGDRAPKIILPTSVSVGRVHVEETTNDQSSNVKLPTRISRIVWDRIPESAAGTTLDYIYTVCGPSSRTADTICALKTIKVTFSAEDQGPKVTRVDWPSDKTQYVRAGETLTKNVQIVDRIDASNIVAVEIYPEVYRSEIEWKNGQLIMTPKTEGKRFFQLVAKSIYRQMTLESFTLDVLPADWGTSAVIYGSNAAADASALVAQLPSSNLVSADKEMGERAFALRDRVVLTTDFFNSTTVGSFFKFVGNLNVPVIVTSPALDKNSTDFWSALAADYQLGLKGRLAQLAPNSPDPTNYIFAPTVASALPEPSVPAGLTGTLTSESNSPACMQINDTASCSPMFTLNRPGFSCVVGVRCQKAGKKPVTVLGFEWADLMMDSSDAAVKTQWQKSVFNLN